MKPAYKAEWLRRLKETPPENQLRHRLSNGRGCFCSMGLLADILENEGLIYWCVNEHLYKYNDLPFNGTLPGKLLQHVGLCPNNAEHVMFRNDNSYWDFTEIAKWIEENV